MMVQITIPKVIMKTDKYFEKVYFFLRMMIPMIIFAIKDPWNRIGKKNLTQLFCGKYWYITKVTKVSYRSEDHM